MSVWAGSRSADATWTSTPGTTRSFRVDLPPGDLWRRPLDHGTSRHGTPAASGSTCCREAGARATRRRRPGPGDQPGRRRHRHRVAPRGAAADEIEVSADGVVTVSGRLLGRPATGASGSPRATSGCRSAADQVATDGGRFTATLELRHERYRFGRLPLTTGDHDLSASSSTTATPVEVPLLVSPTLGDSLPLAVHTDDLEGRVVRGPARRRPGHASSARSARARASTTSTSCAGRRPARAGSPAGVLFRSYFGEHATDNGVSIQQELQRRGSDLPVYWAVHDNRCRCPRAASRSW